MLIYLQSSRLLVLHVPKYALAAVRWQSLVWEILISLGSWSDTEEIQKSRGSVLWGIHQVFINYYQHITLSIPSPVLQVDGRKRYFEENRYIDYPASAERAQNCLNYLSEYLYIFCVQAYGLGSSPEHSSLIAQFQKQHSTPHLYMCTFHTTTPAFSPWHRGSCKNKVVVWDYGCPAKLIASVPQAETPHIVLSQTQGKCNWCVAQIITHQASLCLSFQGQF